MTHAPVPSLVLGALLAIAGCGGDGGGARCPDDAPVERDGRCFPEGDAGPGGDMDAGPRGDDDAGTGADDDGGGGGDEDAGPAADAGPVECSGSHPLVEGTRRFCEAGDCYCMASDACFSEETASACCEGPALCMGGGPVDGGPSLDCMRSHPIVGSDGSRTCDPGFCFCADPDSCSPADRADACCASAVTCF